MLFFRPWYFFKTIYSFPKRKSERLIIRMLTKDVERRKDLPHRRMPVIIFIIPLPSAEMCSFKYALRSKYIVYDVFLCQDTVFCRKYAFYLITPNFSIDLTLQKHKKGHDCSCPIDEIFHSEWILSFKTFHSEWIDSDFIPPAASQPLPYPEPRTAPSPLE